MITFRTSCRPKSNASQRLPRPPGAPFLSVDEPAPDASHTWTHTPARPLVSGCFRERRAGTSAGRRGRAPRSCARPRDVRVRGGHGRLWTCACAVGTFLYGRARARRTRRRGVGVHRGRLGVATSCVPRARVCRFVRSSVFGALIRFQPGRGGGGALRGPTGSPRLTFRGRADRLTAQRGPSWRGCLSAALRRGAGTDVSCR